MNGNVAKMFSMRPGEFAPASMLFSYLFLAIGSFILGQSIGDAMFLDVFPRHLPYAFIFTALLIGVFVSFYIRLSHRVRLERLMIGTLLFFTFSFVVFWVLTLPPPNKVVFMFIYIWVQTAGALVPMMGWTLANYLLTTREARRIFGFIQLGAILGGIFVGFLTADLMHRGHIRPQTLLLAVAAFNGTCAILVRLLFRMTRQRMAALSSGPATSKSAPKSFFQSFKVIRNSRYLLLITALIGVSCLATTILGYQFRLICKDHFAHNTAALSEYFARFYGYMGLITLMFQILFTGPLLRKFGIRVTLFVLPVTLLIPTAAVFLFPSILTASLLRGDHYVLRYSLDKSSSELLYLPVSADVKSQVKSFIDTFVFRSADGVAGLVLLLFQNVLKFNPSQVSLVTSVIIFGWIAVAYGMRREYVNVLRQAIERRTLDAERTAAGVLDSTTTEVLARALKRGGEDQVLYGLSLFEMGRETTFHPALRGLLDHPSPAVRQRALRLLGDAGDKEIRAKVEKMLGDASPEVRTEALHYLVVHTRRDPLDLLTEATTFPDYVVQGLVVAYLARTGEEEYLGTAALILSTMLSRSDAEASRSRAEAARMLGVIPPPCPLHSEIEDLLRDESLEVVEQALSSAGKIAVLEWLPLVIEKLGDSRLRGAARTTLLQYGPRAVERLRDCLNDATAPLAIRKQIPDVLVRIPVPQSGMVLAESLTQGDPGLRFDLLKALNKLRRKQPELALPCEEIADLLDAELMGYYRSFQVLAAIDPKASISMRSPGREPVLTAALRERMDRELERIFRLLALLYRPRDIHNAYVGLISGRAQLQANALELLEHILRPDLYRRLACTLDPEVALPDKLKFAEELCFTKVISKAEALKVLLHSEDLWLRACALHAVGKLGLVELQGTVREMPHDGDPIIAETWSWASARLGGATA